MPVRPKVTPPAGFEEVSQSDLASLIGEGVHTGLRKGSDAEDSAALWNAISESETTAWHDAVAFAAYGFEAMGFKVYAPITGYEPS